MPAHVDIVAGGTPADFLTVRHIRVTGSEREIGRSLAIAARDAHGADAGPSRAPDPVVQRARRAWFAANHPTLYERMKGVGAAFGVDPTDDAWDLAWLGTYELPAGCSTVFYPGTGTKDGHNLLARNFDFPTLTYSEIIGRAARPAEGPLAAAPWVVESHPDQGYSSVTIGIMDVLGAMDGVNSAGLGVSLMADNESTAPEPSVVAQVGLSEQQIIRYLLDTCATVDEAKQALLLAKQYYFFVPCHFLVADRTGRSFVWEYSAGHNREHIVEPAPHQRTVCTNHLLHRWPEGVDLPDDPKLDGTAALTYHRYRTLSAAVVGPALVDRNDIRDHFAAVRFTAPVPMARTFWHAVYDLDDPSLEVSFYLRDEHGVSRYTEPRRIVLAR
jgi:predicted choloylglycine hydrolase